MHPIIEKYPEWKKLQSEREKLEKARKIWSERRGKIDASNREALAGFKADCDKALLEGEVPPARPKLKEDFGDVHLFHSKQRELLDLERTFLEAHAEELDRELSDLHDAIIEEAKPKLFELMEATTELRALVTALAKVRGIARPGAPNHLHRGGDYLDIAELARVVVRGGSFIREEQRPMADARQH